MLPQKNRLKKRKEFAYIHKNGKKLNAQHLSIIYIKSKLPIPKIGISVSNKVGNAVKRNKVKRQLREIMRSNLPFLRNHQNIVLSAHPNISECDFSSLRTEIEKLLIKGNLKNE